VDHFLKRVGFQSFLCRKREPIGIACVCAHQIIGSPTKSLTIREGNFLPLILICQICPRRIYLTKYDVIHLYRGRGKINAIWLYDITNHIQ
jgi:hypothetical protein